MSVNLIPIVELKLDEGFDNPKTKKSILLFSEYYKEYYQKDYQDFSFTIIYESKIIGYVLCGLLNKNLSIPDGGVTIELGEISINKQKKIFGFIVDHLIKLSQDHGAADIVIKDRLRSETLSPLGEVLFNKRFDSKLSFEMEIPFPDFREQDFHASMRKSYKSLISWGKKELSLKYINQLNPDRKAFDLFQAFHVKIAGRQTRSQETWDKQFRMIEEGLGEMLLAYYKDDLVAGSFYADYGNTSIYFTGVHERSLFEYGLSHYLLYEGIKRSYERKNTRRFSLGYFESNINDPKWYNIQFFKKGFCKDLKPVIFWTKKG